MNNWEHVSYNNLCTELSGGHDKFSERFVCRILQLRRSDRYWSRKCRKFMHKFVQPPRITVSEGGFRELWVFLLLLLLLVEFTDFSMLRPLELRAVSSNVGLYVLMPEFERTGNSVTNLETSANCEERNISSYLLGSITSTSASPTSGIAAPITSAEVSSVKFSVLSTSTETQACNPMKNSPRVSANSADAVGVFCGSVLGFAVVVASDTFNGRAVVEVSTLLVELAVVKLSFSISLAFNVLAFVMKVELRTSCFFAITPPPKCSNFSSLTLISKRNLSRASSSECNGLNGGITTSSIKGTGRGCGCIEAPTPNRSIFCDPDINAGLLKLL
uniref:Uncharacterized protein n=1 Tax=Glossina brevipalpis TaxID=37001 RepID=A0A1A9W3Z2_9MUSC